MNLNLSLMPYTKLNSKWVTDLNVKYICHLGKNIMKIFEARGIDTRNANYKRKKIEKLNLIEIKLLFSENVLSYFKTSPFL